MDVFDKKFRDIFSFQFISLLSSLVAGTVLALQMDKLLLIPGILIILPGFLEMRGNISGSFASRLSSGLFLGVVKPTRMATKIVKGNLVASFLLAVIVSLILGVIGMVFTFLTLGILTIRILLLPLLAGIISNAIEIPLTLLATFSLFRRGHDPNNIMGPIVTSTGDITSIVSLLIAVVIV